MRQNLNHPGALYRRICLLGRLNYTSPKRSCPHSPMLRPAVRPPACFRLGVSMMLVRIRHQKFFTAAVSALAGLLLTALPASASLPRDPAAKAQVVGQPVALQVQPEQ